MADFISTRSAAIDDRVLLRRFVEEGSAEAFGEVVARHIRGVYAQAKRELRDAGRAEDVTQAVFLLLAQKAGALNPKVLLAGWLYTVTHFTCANARRTEVRRRRHEEEAARMSVSRGDPAPYSDVEEHLDRILQQLPRYERDAILLRYVHDYTPAEIAELMGTTEGAVKKRLVRALRKVRGRFAEMGVVVSAGFLPTTILMGQSVPGSLAVAAVTTALAPSSVVAPVVLHLAKGAMQMLLAAKMKLVAVAVLVVGMMVGVGGILVAENFPKEALPKSVEAAPVVTTTRSAEGSVLVAASMPETMPGMISGVVVDASGKVVGNAFVSSVTYEKAKPVLLASVHTGTDGSFSLPAPPIPTEARGIGPQIFADVPGVGLSEGVVAAKIRNSVTLRLRAASEVHIPLVDPSGKPASGVAVFPVFFYPNSSKNVLTMKDMMADAQDAGARSCLFPKEIAERWSATSDAQGMITLRGIPQNTAVRVEHDDDRYAGLPGGQTFTLNGDPSITLKPLQLSESAMISGTVVFANGGHGAGNITVGAGSTGPGRYRYSGNSITDSTGHFSIKRLAEGKYVVKADVSEMPDYVIAAGEVSTSPRSPAAVSLKAVHGGFVKGAVRDKKTGKGMAHIYVSLYGPSFPKEQGGNDSVWTDADGGFSFREPPGEQFLTINQDPPEGYLYPEANYAHPVSVMVAEGETVTRNLELEPDPAPGVSGEVLDENNAPVAGATILCTLPNPKGISSDGEKEAVTDAQGHFTIAHFRAGMILRVRAGNRATVKATTLKFADDEVVLMVSPEGTYSLTVKPVDEEGNFVAGTTVSLASMNGNFGMGTVPTPVGADGVMHFEHLNKDVSSDVVASAPGYLDVQKTIKPGSAAEVTVKLVLRKNDTPISGIVRDGKGKPVAGVEMVLMAGVMNTTVRTDGEGRYRFLVPAGIRGSVFISGTGGSVGGQKRADAGETDVDFVMPEGAGK